MSVTFMFPTYHCDEITSSKLPGESKKGLAFDRLLLPEHISNDVLQQLMEKLSCSITFRIFPGRDRSLRSDYLRDF